MALTESATLVLVTRAVVGALLASMLMAASIGLLRLRPWSRRLMNGWALLYLVSGVLFLVLEIQIVVPSEVAMVTKMMAAMPQMTPATAPAGPTTAMAVPVMAPGAGVPAAQMARFLSITYVAMSYGKAFISLIFPIAVLIVMQRKTVRTVLRV